MPTSIDLSRVISQFSSESLKTSIAESESLKSSIAEVGKWYAEAIPQLLFLVGLFGIQCKSRC